MDLLIRDLRCTNLLSHYLRISSENSKGFLLTVETNHSTIVFFPSERCTNFICFLQTLLDYINSTLFIILVTRTNIYG